MKSSNLLLPAAVLLLNACGGGGSFNSGSFDPLNAAGGGGGSVGVVNTGFKPGSFVKTSMDNAAFFESKPDGATTADKLLPANTPMKVISTSGSYVKVELDSGEVGYLLDVQVIDQNASGSAYVDDGAVQVYPPVDGVVPVVQPELPGNDLIPTEIDPDAPEPVIPEIPALPDDAPTPGLGAEPALPGPNADAGVKDANEGVEDVLEEVPTPESAE